MRSIGVLACDDCGGEHKVHVNRAGQLIALVSCPASEEGFLGPMARNELRKQLFEARHELELAEAMFGGDRVSYQDLSLQIDEIHRRLVRAQKTLDAHLLER